jgi:hypothetical protein
MPRAVGRVPNRLLAKNMLEVPSGSFVMDSDAHDPE